MAFFQPILRSFFLLAIFLGGLTLSGPVWSLEPIKIIAFGDSLTAGLGLAEKDALPARLEAALRDKGLDVTIINAGVSGDTATGGLARLEWTIGQDVDGIIVELGANDALRGIDPAITRDALDQILQHLQDKNIPVLLAGMIAPLNMGSTYGRAFNPIYGELATQYQALLYPFFLDGVAADPALNQPDGLHPNHAGVDEIVKRILPSVENLIAEIEASR